MHDKKIRKYIKERINLEISKDKSLTKEGIVDRVIDHIKDVLQKANDRRFNVAMDQLAKSGPEGKKAAQSFYDSVDLIDRAGENAQKLIDKYEL